MVSSEEMVISGYIVITKGEVVKEYFPGKKFHGKEQLVLIVLHSPRTFIELIATGSRGTSE